MTGRQPFRLDGRVAVITGAASGIGRATAEMYARAGADLVLGWYRDDPHDIGETVRLVEQHGTRVVDVEGNVARTEDVERLVGTARQRFGKVDIVVANAGIARLVPTEELDDDRWDELMSVNLGGVFRCFRAAIPSMREQGWGRLLATSSIVGAFMSWADHAHYAAAKGGIAGLVRSLAGELGPDGITANAVAPGVVESPQTLDAVNSLGSEGLEAFAPRVPLRRIGRPEEIASAFLYLASDEGAYVNGRVLLVDGGANIAGA